MIADGNSQDCTMWNQARKHPPLLAVIKSPLIIENELEVSCLPIQHEYLYLEFSFQHIQQKFGRE